MSIFPTTRISCLCSCSQEEIGKVIASLEGADISVQCLEMQINNLPHLNLHKKLRPLSGAQFQAELSQASRISCGDREFWYKGLACASLST